MKEYKSDVHYNEPFPKRLRELMDERKVTQQALASSVKVKRQTISAYARGEVEPPLKSLVAMADFFQISLDNLAGKAECETPENEGIHKRLGLTDGAIEKLDEYYHSVSPLPFERAFARARPFTISALLETKEGEELLDSIGRYAFANLSRMDDHDADRPSANGIKYVQFNAGRDTPLRGTGFVIGVEKFGEAICILDINEKLKDFRRTIKPEKYGYSQGRPLTDPKAGMNKALKELKAELIMETVYSTIRNSTIRKRQEHVYSKDRTKGQKKAASLYIPGLTAEFAQTLEEDKKRAFAKLPPKKRAIAELEPAKAEQEESHVDSADSE